MGLPRQTTRRELIRKFRALGWEGPVSGGRHSFMRRGSLKVHIPNEHQSDIGRPLLGEILRQAGITIEEWLGA
jgi:predicted RNA binding protein YcfA (HicA-like mRNA interferase family)